MSSLSSNGVHYKPGVAYQLTMINAQSLIVGRYFKNGKKKPGLSKCDCSALICVLLI